MRDHHHLAVELIHPDSVPGVPIGVLVIPPDRFPVQQPERRRARCCARPDRVPQPAGPEALDRVVNEEAGQAGIGDQNSDQPGFESRGQVRNEMGP